MTSTVRHQGRHLEPGRDTGSFRDRFELDDHPDRLLSMEGLRGLAVILVFIVHIRTPLVNLVPPGAFSHTLLNAGWRIGHTGVDLFFIISGYLIYKAILRRRVNYATFMRRRYRRIYPTFLAVFLLYVVVAYGVPSLGIMPKVESDSLYLLSNLMLLPGMFTIQPLIAVAWTLSFEMFYYLLVPVVVTVLALRSKEPRYRLVTILGLGALCLALTPVIGPMRSRMFLFIVGMGIHEVMSAAPGLKSNRIFDALALCLGVIAIGISGYVEVPPVDHGTSAEPTVGAALARNLVLGIGLGVLTFSCFRSTGWLKAWFSWTPLRYLGNMSYSYYLIHSFVISAMAAILLKILPSTVPGWMLIPVVLLLFAGTLVASAGLFLCIERPLSLTKR